MRQEELFQTIRISLKSPSIFTNIDQNSSTLKGIKMLRDGASHLSKTYLFDDYLEKMAALGLFSFTTDEVVVSDTVRNQILTNTRGVTEVYKS